MGMEMANAETAAVIDHKTRASEIVSIFQALSGGSNVHIDDGWARLLGTAKSSEEFYLSIGAISKSLDLLKIEIEESALRPASKEKYIGAVNVLKTYVSVENLRSSQTEHVKAQADAFGLLTLLDDVLLPISNHEISEKTLSAWKAELSALIDGANRAIHEETLRSFVINQLSSLEWAINNYKWVGVEGISKAFGAMTSELARSQGMRGGQDPSAQTWYAKAKKPILAIGAALVAVSAVAENSDKILTHGNHILELIGGNSDEKSSEGAKSTGANDTDTSTDSGTG
jgi:hypothetical protein